MLDFGFYNDDCMKIMAQLPDKSIDLAIVDPPYGIGYDKAVSKTGGTQYGKSAAKKTTYHTADWDNSIPDEAYFDELFRVSKNQIIWGGNYFTEYLPPSKGWIVWDKRCNEKFNNDFADCELAWTNMGVARVFRYLYNGMIVENMANKEYRIHPTQKPIDLYIWLLNHYAKEGWTILDTHVGSASSLIACHKAGLKYIGCELDPVYYEKAKERLENETSQVTLFDLMGGKRNKAEEIDNQTTLADFL